MAVLIALVERAIEAGASEMEVEYKDGWEEIYAVGSGIGVGIARLDATSAEARALRKELYAIPKERKVRSFRPAGARIGCRCASKRVLARMRFASP